MKHFSLVVLVIVLTTAACDNSSSSTTPTTGDSVTVTLTSAVETLPGGTLNPSVVMGIGIGTIVGTGCTVPAGTTQLLSASATPLSGTLNPGTWCLQVTNEDASATSGPVAYTVVIVATSSTTTATNSQTLSGTVPAAVNGVPQSVFNTFTAP
jgi:hypothetical protein